MKKIVHQIGIVMIVTALSACSHSNNMVLEGKVKRETISLAPKLAGRILKIYVSESDVVKAGDTLVMLDVPEVNAKLQQAEGATFSATNQYEMALHGATAEQKNQVIALYNSAKEQLQLAEKSVNRVRNMFKDSLVSAQTYDEAVSKLNLARLQYDAALAKKQEVEKGVRDEQVKMTQGQKKQAEGVLKEVHVALNERYIIAPIDMTIETIALHEGELALPGYNIIIGYNPLSTWFRFTITESQIMQFKKDSIYTIELPFIQKTAQARLTSINEIAKYGNKTSPYPSYQMGEAVYEVKFVPEDKKAAADLLNNFTVLLKK